MSEERRIPNPGRFTLAHLSDPHLSSLHGVGLRELVGKRLLGYLTWRYSRSAEHRSEVLDALVDDLYETRPDHLAITGDLTHLGLPREFDEVRCWLEGLGPSDQVTVVPGNHDAYALTPWQEGLGRWAPYLVSDGVLPGAANPDALFPSLRIRREVALIGLSTARPSAPLLAIGSLGTTQLSRLAELLVETREQGLCRILLLHHPPVAGSVAWRKRLTDAAGLREVIARYGVELVLHGHAHRSMQTELITPRGRALTLGVPSASAIGRHPGSRAQYALYSLSPSPSGGWELQLRMRAYSPTEGRFLPAAEPVQMAYLAASGAATTIPG